ncbi:TadE/TadG family type IV pilus assembly protein [Vibrio comitans]|uniref:TadE/TadG family type IV pilus assembly protein n=1 Tax=Vibrio comitans TaxID=413401 RepID=UPI001FCBC1EB|nr:TadE/TadG family type IV pilus assembly protein [Vibrio comitans]
MSIEFSLGAIAFFTLIIGVFEIGRFIFITNMTESTLSESTRKVRIYEGEKLDTSYENRLNEVFNDSDSLWNSLGIVDAKQFSFQAKPYLTLQDVASETARVGCERCPLVVYELSYHYTPMVMADWFWSGKITRKLLTIQEHEGWEDEG